MAGSGLQIQLWFDVYANKARGDSHEAVLFVVRGDEKPEELKQRADFCDSFPEVAHFGSDLIEFVDTADGIINDEEEFSMIGLLHDNSQDEPYFGNPNVHDVLQKMSHARRANERRGAPLVYDVHEGIKHILFPQQRQRIYIL